MRCGRLRNIFICILSGVHLEFHRRSQQMKADCFFLSVGEYEHNTKVQMLFLAIWHTHNRSDENKTKERKKFDFQINVEAIVWFLHCWKTVLSNDWIDLINYRGGICWCGRKFRSSLNHITNWNWCIERRNLCAMMSRFKRANPDDRLNWVKQTKLC